MKVLMVNKFLYPKGGAENYVLKLGKYLESQGHNVQYFGMDHPKRCVGNCLNIYVNNTDLSGKIGIPDIMNPTRTVYNAEARQKIGNILTEIKPDIIHLNNFNYQLTPSIILEMEKWRRRENRQCKIVYTAHDGQLICPNHLLANPNTKKLCKKCLGRKYLNCIRGRCIHGSFFKSLIGAYEAFFWNWKEVYKYIDVIICCSEFMREIINTNPILKNKTITMHNFADIIEYEDIEKENYVLYFGRYEEEKGIKTLLEACKRLPEIKFIFAGEGKLENEVNKVNNVKNIGFVTGDELINYIRKAKFSVCPSEWYENCPFAVIESQIYGTPVIGSNIGGIPELIEAGETGELFVPGDVLDLASKIEKLWMDSDKTRKYSINCRKIKSYDIKSYCDRLVEIYQQGIYR